MPHKMCDGYFYAEEVKKKFFRSMGPHGEKEKHFKGVGSVKGEQVFITWISTELDEDGMVYTHHEVRDLKSCRIHTTLA
jgi:hypothetical protein